MRSRVRAPGASAAPAAVATRSSRKAEGVLALGIARMLRSRPGLGKSEIGAEHRSGRSHRDRDRLDGGRRHLRGAVHDPAPCPRHRVRRSPRVPARGGARGPRRALLRHPLLGDAAGRRELRLREPGPEPLPGLRGQLLAVVLALHRHRRGEVSPHAFSSGTSPWPPARRPRPDGSTYRRPGSCSRSRSCGPSRAGEPPGARDLPARAPAAPRPHLPPRSRGHRRRVRPRPEGAPQPRGPAPAPPARHRCHRGRAPVLQLHRVRRHRPGGRRGRDLPGRSRSQSASQSAS